MEQHSGNRPQAEASQLDNFLAGEEECKDFFSVLLQCRQLSEARPLVY